MVDPERLQTLPLFGELDAYDLGKVARWVDEIRATPGDLLIEQGTMPFELFVIERGRVEVVQDGIQIATAGAGDVVGEIALLEQHRRMATVRALTEVIALALPVDGLQALTVEMPELGDELRGIMDRRQAENEAR
jgi:CRP/FNR family transcriptional regulator